MESLIDKIKQDLEELALEHLGAAKNEHLWALGSDAEAAALHKQNSEEHLAIANMFQRMADQVVLVIEQFGGM